MLDCIANEPPTQGAGLKPRPCIIRGEPRWLIETYSGGKRKRQFFPTESEANKALKAVQKDRADLGRAFSVMSAKEKADLMHILKEIQDAGMTLPQVWNLARAIPNAPKAIWTLRTAIDETIKDLRDNNRREIYIDGVELYLNAYARGREATLITQHGVKEIKKWLSDRKEAPETRNSNLGRFSSMFDCAWRNHQITENPCDRIKRARIDAKTPTVFTLAQSKKACHWAQFVQPKALAWFTLTHFMGMRPEAEAQKVKKTFADLKRGRAKIAADETKVRDHRAIDLKTCPPALSWLQLAKKRKAQFQLSKSTIKRYRRQLRDYLGMKSWPQDIMRHTAASALYGYHQDAGKVAQFLGTSAAMLLKRYKVPMFKEDADKFMALLPE